LINPEYKEFFFNAIKKDYAAKQKEYEEVLDFSKINDRSKIIFNSVLSASTPREFEIQLKISTLENNVRRLRNENQRLKKENKSLKDFKKSILNSNSWKITKPLRKIRNL
jgi:phospholipid N-methyltransferase